MGVLELLFIAIGLSMDAFAVSVCLGLARQRFAVSDGLRAGAYFGAFQALMPAIGWFVGGVFADKIERFDHWAAFGLLAFIGARMLIESRSQKGAALPEDAMRPSKMLPLAVATSIDALIVGVSFAFVGGGIAAPVIFIGAVTFAFCFIGVRIGSLFGSRIGKWATMAGGAILIIVGAKILLEHLGAIG